MSYFGTINSWPSLAIGLLTFILSGGPVGADLVAVPDLGLRVERGFRVSLFADADLANDIFAIAFDSRSNLVVTGDGYVRVLPDRDHNGRADSAQTLISTKTGGMGLAFGEDEFLFMGDGGLLRFHSGNNGVYAGRPDELLKFPFAEHGGHAVRQGPDGSWYVIAGNETPFAAEHTSQPGSPVRIVEAGALLRLNRDGNLSEVLAHGFRNPYDFDFNGWGDIFTYDSDVEHDSALPWYLPTRVYHVLTGGGHHGWRLPGWTRSWPRPPYYQDSAEIMTPLGRGSPTGVAAYRHLQFPQSYRNGLFVLDWTFGSIYFLPLNPDGSSYRAPRQIFLEPIGSQGFAPTDIAVGPDGSLYVSIGGRHTRGGVYRIEYVAEPELAWNAANWLDFALSDLDAVLQTPQPLEAWSRTFWVPAARRLGAEPFDRVAEDEQLTADYRVRAIEILTEIHGGLRTRTASVSARSASYRVRQRVAWSLGRVPCTNFEPILLGLARDAQAAVRYEALSAILEQSAGLNSGLLLEAVQANWGHVDERVQQVTAQIAARLPEPEWQRLWKQGLQSLPQARLTAALASFSRLPPNTVNTPALQIALAVLKESKVVDQRLQAARLIILALGDYQLRQPSVEVYTAYEPGIAFEERPPVFSQVSQAIAPLFPSGNPFLDLEITRLAAMVQSDDADLPRRILLTLAARGTPTADFHYLTVLSRLRGRTFTNATAQLAATILGLDRKLETGGFRTGHNWMPRLNEVLDQLLQRDPGLAEAMIKNPEFVRPAHLAFVPLLGAEKRIACGRAFLSAVRNRPFPWSEALIDLLAAQPPNEVIPLLRLQWANITLRDRLLLELARTPEPVDRDKFVTGLTSTRPNTVAASLTALLRLNRDNTSGTLVAALRVLRRAVGQADGLNTRTQALALVNRELAQVFQIQETGTNAAALSRAYQPVFDYMTQRSPAVLAQLDAADQANPGQWEWTLKNVLWDRGNAARGEAIFQERGCQVCHRGSTRLGPDLAGAADRWSPIDLFQTIIFPSREVAPAYRTVSFRTRDGQTTQGIVVFESPDVVIVQTGAASTVRLGSANIVGRQASGLSLMPSDLLTGLHSNDLADLYSYLKTLRRP